jgi:hypothetical protein
MIVPLSHATAVAVYVRMPSMYSQVDDRHRAVEDPTFTVVLQFHSEEDEPFQGSPRLPEIFLFVARSGLPFEQFPEWTTLH